MKELLTRHGVCMNNKKTVLLIQTDTFILPIFQKLGAFITGKFVENNSESGWLTNQRFDHEEDLAAYWEEEDLIMNGIREIYINPLISTPFFPVPSSEYFSDGFGNINNFKNLDKNKRAVINLRNKAIADLYSKRIKILHNLKKGKSNIKALKRKKKMLCESKLRVRIFYSDLGIAWDDEPDKECVEIIKTRANSFAKTHGFKITNFKVVSFNYEWIKSLSDLN